MGRTASNEKVELVPGVEAPRWIEDDNFVDMSKEGGAVGVRVRVEYDDNSRRYLCTRFEVFRSPDADNSQGFVTSELLRDIPVGHYVAMTLFTPSGWKAYELPNVDNVEPWGVTAPDGLREEGPTDRSLQWVAHLYRFAMAIALNPAKTVQDTLGLAHGTASRWIRLARQKGYLGASQGPGRAAG